MGLKVYPLGLVEYGKALDLQRKLSLVRKENKISDTLLLLEHNPVFTIGRMGKQKEILVDREKLTKEGIEVFEIERGGSTTYHGPGQLVGYPIINLKEIPCSAITFLRKLEEVLIDTLKDFKIDACTIKGKTGVWVNNAKIASIGIHVSHWITRHGFALNVCNPLHYFDMIIPCGMPDCMVTNVSNVINRHVQPNEMIAFIVDHFARIFNVEYTIVDEGIEDTAIIG